MHCTNVVQIFQIILVVQIFQIILWLATARWANGRDSETVSRHGAANAGAGLLVLTDSLSVSNPLDSSLPWPRILFRSTSTANYFLFCLVVFQTLQFLWLLLYFATRLSLLKINFASKYSNIESPSCLFSPTAEETAVKKICRWFCNLWRHRCLYEKDLNDLGLFIGRAG